jgi:hypothetical protein
MMALIWIAATCSNDVTAPPTELQLSTFRFDLPSPAPTVVAGSGSVTITGRFSSGCGEPKAFAQLRSRRLTVYLTQVSDGAVNCPDLLRIMAYTVLVRGLKRGELAVDVFQDSGGSEFDAKAPATTVVIL